MDREGWLDLPMDPFGFRRWEPIHKERKTDQGSENHGKLVSYIVYRRLSLPSRRNPPARLLGKR